MNKIGIVLIALGLSFFILLGWFQGNYNSAVKLRNEAKTQNAQIEAQMQRRADLIPNLVTSTRGAMKQEKAVFDDISKAHAAFTQAPSGTDAKIQAGEALSTAIRGYMVVAQQYPNLKSLDIVVSLNDEMSGTENRIVVARERYNEDVQSFNNKIQQVPLSFFAGAMGFSEMKLYTASASAQVAPVVNFGELE